MVLAALLVWREHILITVAAFGFSLATVGAFLMARYCEIFGYSETLWRTPAIVAVSVELGAAVLLALVAARQLAGAGAGVQPLPR